MARAAVLIPSPYVAENHQYLNAKALADVNAARLVEESGLKDGVLTETLREMIENPSCRAAYEREIAQFADAAANRRIWEDILTLTQKKDQRKN